MGTVATQITRLTIIYSTVYSGADQRKHQCSASLAFVRGIHRGPVNSLHKWPVTRKMFPFDDVIMVPDLQMSYNVLTKMVRYQKSGSSRGRQAAWAATVAPFRIYEPYDSMWSLSHALAMYQLHHHDDVIKWKHFPCYWPFVRGIHRSRWIPHTKASDAELWCFLWSASE